MTKERMAEKKDIKPSGSRKEVRSYPFPTIETYSAALKNRLEIDEEELQRLTYTNRPIKEWMGALRPSEDGREPVTAIVGKAHIRLSSDMELPEKITKETPVSQVLQADALYLAKLAFVEEAAPHVTSWGRSTLKRKEVEKQINELLGVKAKIKLSRVPRMGDVFTGKNLKKAAILSTFVLTSACTSVIPETGITSVPVEPIITEPTETPFQPEVSPTPTETEEPTPTPTEEPAPEYDLKEGQKKIQDEEERWLIVDTTDPRGERTILRWDEESGEWVDWIFKLTSPDGRVSWIVDLSYVLRVTGWEWGDAEDYEYTDPQTGEIRMQLPPERWEEALWLSIWQYAVQTGQGKTLAQIREGTTVNYNLMGENYTVDTSKPVDVRFTNNFPGEAIKYRMLNGKNMAIHIKEDGSLVIYISLTFAIRSPAKVEDWITHDPYTRALQMLFYPEALKTGQLQSMSEYADTLTASLRNFYDKLWDILGNMEGGLESERILRPELK